MHQVSKDTASEKIALDGLDVQLEHLDGGYSVCFESHTADADLADLFRGLPDDRAQLPRWGYVIKGKVGFRFADREETYEAGDAYYVPPGHTPVHYAGAEIVEFSPTEILGETIPVVMRNLQSRRGGDRRAAHELRARLRDRLPSLGGPRRASALRRQAPGAGRSRGGPGAAALRAGARPRHRQRGLGRRSSPSGAGR